MSPLVPAVPAGVRLVTSGLGRELRHRAGAAACVLLAAGGIGMAAASAPLFLSAARSASLQQSIAGACPASSGLSAEAFVPMRATDPGVHDAAVAAAVADIDALGGPIRTTVGPTLRLHDVPVRLLHRDGLAEEVTILADAGGDGALVAATVQEATGVQPGDDVSLELYAGRGSTVRVRGIYQDVVREPRRRSLCSMVPVVYGGLDPPPAPVLVDRATALRVGSELDDDGSLLWELPLEVDGLDAEEAAVLGRRLRAAVTELSETGLFAAQGRQGVGASLGEHVALAEDTAGAATPAVTTLAAAAVGLGLVLLVVSAWQWARSLGATAELLDGRGGEPAVAGARVTVAALLPAVAGLAAGWAAAGPIVRRLGPSADLDAVAAGDARRLVVLLVPVAVAAIAVPAVAHRPGRAGAGPPGWFLPAGLASAALAVAAGYELAGDDRPAPRGPGRLPEIDRFAVLFPLLALLAAALLGAVLVAASLRRIGGRPPSPRRPAVYLARRRLGHQRRSVATSFAAASLAVGMFAYGATIDASTDATARARSLDAVGGDASVFLPAGVDPPALPGTTAVRRDSAVLGTGTRTTRVQLVGIDPATFASTVPWRSSYGVGSAEEVAATVAAGGAYVLGLELAGGEGVIDLGSHLPDEAIAVDVITGLDGFPTLDGRTATLVLDAGLLPNDVVGAGTTEVWVRGEVPDELRTLVGPEDVLTAGEVLDGPAASARRWGAGYTAAVAAGFGMLLLLAVAVAAQRRRGAGLTTLLDRMGLRPGAAWRSTAIEVAVPVLAGLALGAALSGVVTGVVLDPLDAEPGAAVGAVRTTPTAELGALTVGTVVAVAVASRTALATTRRRAAGVIGVDRG